MADRQRQILVSDLDRRLQEIMPAELSERALKLFKFIWRSELAERQTDVTAAIVFLATSRRPAYNAIYELEGCGFVRRVTDAQLRRRKLLRVTRFGWDTLAKASARYSDVIADHARQLAELRTNWIDFHETRAIGENQLSPMVRAMHRWSGQRSNEPIPTQFLDRVFVLDVADANPEAFKVTYWGRSLQLMAGHDFAGQQLVDLRKFSSKAYWRQGAGAIVEGLKGSGKPVTHEVRLNFGDEDRCLQRIVIPDRSNCRAIVGTWFVDPCLPAGRQAANSRPLSKTGNKD